MIDFISTIEAGDYAIIFATLLGPILAVQAQKWIELSRERRNSKLTIFSQLMATRAARLSPMHVQALNMIDIVFYGKFFLWMHRRTKKEQDILNAWKEYHDNLGEGRDEPPQRLEAILAKRDELFLNLLHRISVDVGYSFDRVQLKNSSYSPQAHGDSERINRELVTGLLKAISGEQPIPIKLITDDKSNDFSKEHAHNVERIANSLESNAVIIMPRSQKK